MRAAHALPAQFPFERRGRPAHHARMDFIRPFVSAVAAALSALHRAWASARMRRELHELSDRTLKDIGLSRGQIDQLFR
jgi:uncharacterized protein YjiS (DUF1127 family)